MILKQAFRNSSIWSPVDSFIGVALSVGILILLRRSLEKDPKRRLDSAAAARICLPSTSNTAATFSRWRSTNTCSSASTAAPSPSIYEPAIESYISAIQTTGAAQGLSSSTLTSIVATVRQHAGELDGYQKQFFDTQKSQYLKSQTVLSKAFVAINDFIFPQIAHADVGLPFGGYLTIVDPIICNCPPGVTHLFVFLPQPTPTSNLLLDYIDGSEGFLWYNLPVPGLATVGAYTPGLLTCFTYVGAACVPVPAVGTIDPIVGSSPGPLPPI